MLTLVRILADGRVLTDRVLSVIHAQRVVDGTTPKLGVSFVCGGNDPAPTMLHPS